MPTCPSCGHNAYIGFTQVECSNSSCWYYKASREKEKETVRGIPLHNFLYKVYVEIITSQEWKNWEQSQNIDVYRLCSSLCNYIKHILYDSPWKREKEYEFHISINLDPHVILEGKTRVISFSNKSEVYLELNIKDIINKQPLLNRRSWKIPEEIC